MFYTEMHLPLHKFCKNLILTICIAECVSCLSNRKEREETVRTNTGSEVSNDKCDQTLIPVMNNFDFNKFSGDWYEVSKTVSGYIDVDDGMWRISSTQVQTSQKNFLFSGRDNNQHCIRSIKGKITPSTEPPGLLNLEYQTYSTRVKETIRVLFTDYASLAVIYACLHVNVHTGACHEAGIYGAIWSREKHADAELYSKALKYLELACLLKDTLRVRNLVGPCDVDDVGYRDDEFPAPDFCYQPLSLGSCQANVQRFYHDSQEKTCKNFTYGGCQGNGNNFMSLKECQMQCVSVSSREPVCMSTSPCGIHCPPCCREDKLGCVQCDCETIIVDHFINCLASPSMCRQDCKTEEKYPGCFICDCGETDPQLENVATCEEIKDVGKCSETLERFYYNAISQSCERFVYTGCKGNNNNFLTIDECIEKCHRHPKLTFSETSLGDSAAINTCELIIVFIVVFLSSCLFN